jgi:hypothetical protein
VVPGCSAAGGGADHCRRDDEGGDFEPVEGPVNDRIDDAYRKRYHDNPYLSPMIGLRARSATVTVLPRQTKA